MEIASRKKLKLKTKKKVMTNEQIKRFIMHYERITKNMLKNYKKNDVILFINKQHKIKSIKF